MTTVTISHLSLAENSVRLTWLQQPQEQRYPSFPEYAVFIVSMQTVVCGCQCLGFVTCMRMFMQAIAHWGCTDTVRESALEADSSLGEKSLAASGIRTRVSIAPGVSVRRSANFEPHSVCWARHRLERGCVKCSAAPVSTLTVQHNEPRPVACSTVL